MPELRKELSLFGLVMVAIGAAVGSGIFTTPATIAHELPSPNLIALVWTVGGIITLTGALTFAELGGMYPKAGGIYVYLREAYGELIAFLYGWTMLTVTTTASIAALAITFGYYIDSIYPIGYNGITIVAIAAIVCVTFINLFGVKLSERFLSALTSGKILGIAILIGVGIWVAIGNHGAVLRSSSSAAIMPTNLSTAFASALIGVLFSYGGWQHTSFLAGETHNAEYKIPRAMIIGAFAIILIYLLANFAYLSILPIEKIENSKAIATDALSQVVGPNGGFLIAILIAVSTLGTISIYTLSTPRIYYAMAQDGLFFKQMAKLHPTYHTPANAILLQSFWAIVLLILWGTFENLVKYVVFVDWIFFCLAAIAVFIFRKNKPNAVRPYKTILYPLTPMIFIGISVWFIISTLIENPKQAIAGLILLGAGIPLFYLFKRKTFEK
jgi:APA family basic amino acid/polyamine antiporter